MKPDEEKAIEKTTKEIKEESPEKEEEEELSKTFVWKNFRFGQVPKMWDKLNKMFDSGWRFKHTGMRDTAPIFRADLFRVTLFKTPKPLVEITKIADLREYAEDKGIDIPEDLKQSQAIKKFIRDYK